MEGVEERRTSLGQSGADQRKQHKRTDGLHAVDEPDLMHPTDHSHSHSASQSLSRSRPSPSPPPGARSRGAPTAAPSREHLAGISLFMCARLSLSRPCPLPSAVTTIIAAPLSLSQRNGCRSLPSVRAQQPQRRRRLAHQSKRHSLGSEISLSLSSTETEDRQSKRATKVSSLRVVLVVTAVLLDAQPRTQHHLISSLSLSPPLSVLRSRAPQAQRRPQRAPREGQQGGAGSGGGYL